MTESSQPGCSKLTLVKKHAQGRGFYRGEETTIINVYKTLLKDNSHTAISDTAGKVASSMGVAMSSVFKILREYKPTGQVQSLQDGK
jgi:hypothetical protein